MLLLMYQHICGYAAVNNMYLINKPSERCRVEGLTVFRPCKQNRNTHSPLLTVVFFQSCHCSVLLGCHEQHSCAVQTELNKTAGAGC